MFLLNLCLQLKTDNTSPKLEKASLTAWSLMSSGRKIVTKTGSFPLLTRPSLFPKFRHISELPKWYWIYVQQVSPSPFLIQIPKQTLKEKICTEHLSLSLPQILEYGKYPILESFFWVYSEHIMRPSSDLSLIQEGWISSRDLCQTLIVLELFQPAKVGSRFSPGVKKSSSEGRMKR